MKFRFLVMLGITLVSPPAARAQSPAATQLTDSVQRLADRAWQTGNLAAADDALTLLKPALDSFPGDSTLLYYKGYIWYRKGTVLTAAKQKRDALAALDSAERSLEASDTALRWPESVALRAAVLGQRIAAGGGAFSTMRLGRRSNSLMDRAAELGPANPRVFLLRGIGALHKPRMFGGGASRAGEELAKAVSLFEADHPAAPAPAWGHSEAYTWLGQAYEKLGRVADARMAYQRALESDPGNELVRLTLLPRLASDTMPPDR